MIGCGGIIAGIIGVYLIDGHHLDTIDGVMIIMVGDIMDTMVIVGIGEPK